MPLDPDKMAVVQDIGGKMDALDDTTDPGAGAPPDDKMDKPSGDKKDVNAVYDELMADPKYKDALMAAEGAAGGRDTIISMLKKATTLMDDDSEATVKGFAAKIDMAKPPKEPMDLFGAMGGMYGDKKKA